MDSGFDQRDRESLVADLAASDEEVRRLAIERVGGLPLEEALPMLVDRLGDPSWRVRKASVERLVACSDSAATARALVVALGDGENPGRRNSAVEALVHCGARAVPELLAASATNDVDVRKLVVDALAGIGDVRSRETLLELLADSDVNVRAAAADALGAIGGEDVWEALLALAIRDDEDQLVQFSALHALSALEVPVHAHELGPVLADPMLRAQGLALLGRRDDDPEAVAELLKSLVSSSRSCREASMRSLLRLLGHLDGARGEELVEQIRAACAASESTLRSAIEHLPEADLARQLVLIQFLGLLGAPAGLVPILRAGRDEALAQVALSTLEAVGEVAERCVDEAWRELDSVTRRDACTLFGRTGGARGEARLFEALEAGDPELRIAAARSIGRRRVVAALPLLVGRLEVVAVDEDFESEEEMLAVTEALIAVGQPAADGDDAATGQAVELMRSHLDGAPETVRLSIAKVLGCIGRREDTDLVAFLLKDPSALVRRAAVDALARLEPGTASEPLRLALADESTPVRIAAAAALGASKSDAVIADLERLAGDEDPRVRATAVRAVGLRFGASDDPALRAAALGVLESALEDEALVALGAVETLAEIGGPGAARAVPLLERAEPELVKGAVTCVARHGDAGGLEALVPLVSHSDWSVRAEAIQALSDRRVVRSVPPILRRLETEQDEFVRGVILHALKRLEG